MTETVLAPLAGWESYYVIVGSSAAALTGLQFVVIALINDLHTRSVGRHDRRVRHADGRALLRRAAHRRPC